MSGDRITFGYGELNPIRRPNSSKNLSATKVKRTRFLDTVREAAASNQYEFDALEGTGPYYGIVVETQDQTSQDTLPYGNGLRSYIARAKAGDAGNGIVTVRVRIPELHSDMVDPFLVEGEQGTVQFANAARMYPTFTGPAEGIPDVGTLVQVDFTNRQNMEGGVLLSIPGDQPSLGNGGTENGSDAFANREGFDINASFEDRDPRPNPDTVAEKKLTEQQQDARRRRVTKSAEREFKGRDGFLGKGTFEEMSFNGHQVYLDVSTAQRSIDHEAAAAAGVTGWWIKATERTRFVSPAAPYHAEQLKRIGAKYSFYHFAQPAQNGPVPEADHFINFIKDFPGSSLRPVLDYEKRWTRDRDLNTAWVIIFGQRVEQKLGIRPMLYCGKSIFGRFHEDEVRAFFGPPWIARYTVKDKERNNVPHTRQRETAKEIGNPFGDEGGLWTAWQYSSTYRPVWGGHDRTDVNVVARPSDTLAPGTY